MLSEQFAGLKEVAMDVISAIRGRRSINFFDPDRKVPSDTLRELLETANLSPSSFNLQPWEIVVVDDPERKKALRKHAFNQEKVEVAPAVLIVVANPNAVEENIDDHLASMVRLGYIKPEEVEKLRKSPFGLYGEKEGLRRKIFAVKNAAFYAMSLMIAARGFGLETHPMDGFREDAVKAEFGIPEDRIIPLLIAVGYPKPGLSLLPRNYRRELGKFVSFNNFRK